jgi:hypothetical protein
MVITLNGRDLQRDAGMIIILKKIKSGRRRLDHDRYSDYKNAIKQQCIQSSPLQEGEFVIMSEG